MGKKKPFIDKKNASTYHVVRRSQRDVGHVGPDGEPLDVPSEFVLMPSSPDNESESNRTAANVSTVQRSSQQQPPSSSSSVMSKLRSRVASAGLLADAETYDYERHLKPITGTGVFFSGETGHVADASADPRSLVVAEEGEEQQQQLRGGGSGNGHSLEEAGGGVNEVSRQLESIALTPDCMDDDVAQALFGDFEEGDFEEILDDFCITAAQEPESEQEAAAASEFDYDAHIRSLMERAERQAGGGDFAKSSAADHVWAKEGESFFRDAKPLHLRDADEEGDDDDDDVHSLDREFDDGHPFEGSSGGAPGVVPALDPDRERALCEKFEATLAEYDSDDYSGGGDPIGDLDDECDAIRGDLPLEGDRVVEEAFDQFLQEKKDDIFIEGTRNVPGAARRVGGSSYSALVGRTMVRAEELKSSGNGGEGEEEGGAVPPVQEVLAEADVILANPEMEPPPEDVLIDGKSYFSEAQRNPFDCESILTTYSNLDNNPAVIARSGRRRKKGKGTQRDRKAGLDLPEEEPAQILLSDKTGLPLGVLPSRGEGQEEEEANRWGGGDDYDTFVSVNKGEARRREESKSEKKERKAAVKEERRVARLQKKMMKEAFANEFTKRTGDVATNEVAGQSVFRYS